MSYKRASENKMALHDLVANDWCIVVDADNALSGHLLLVVGKEHGVSHYVRVVVVDFGPRWTPPTYVPTTTIITRGHKDNDIVVQQVWPDSCLIDVRWNYKQNELKDAYEAGLVRTDSIDKTVSDDWEDMVLAADEREQ